MQKKINYLTIHNNNDDLKKNKINKSGSHDS